MSVWSVLMLLCLFGLCYVVMSVWCVLMLLCPFGVCWCCYVCLVCADVVMSVWCVLMLLCLFGVCYVEVCAVLRCVLCWGVCCVEVCAILRCVLCWGVTCRSRPRWPWVLIGARRPGLPAESTAPRQPGPRCPSTEWFVAATESRQQDITGHVYNFLNHK